MLYANRSKTTPLREFDVLLEVTAFYITQSKNLRIPKAPFLF